MLIKRITKSNLSVFYSLVLTLLCFNSAVVSQELKISTNDSIISWKSTYKIEWSDYSGKMNPNIFAYAITSYKINIIPENVIVDSKDQILNYHNLTVRADFYKKQSWTISNDINLLNHERLHFDIAELFARKIRIRFEELKTIKEKRYSVYWDEYNILWKACREFQKQYDLETNHGANLEENEKWISKINALL